MAQTKLDSAKPQDRAAAKADLDKANDAVAEAQATAQTSRDLMADLQGRHDNFAGAPDKSEVITKQAELAKARRDLVRLQAEQKDAEKKAADAKAQHKSATDIATADANATKARNAVASAQAAIATLEEELKKAQRDSASSAGQRKGEAGKNPLPLMAYRDGGTVPGWGNEDSQMIAAMPGEEIIRKKIAEKPGVRSFLKQLNAGQLAAFAGGGTVGGFGGYADDNSDWMRPTSLSDWFGLATGAGFAAASVISPYASIAYDFATDGAGSISLGDMAPQPSTGTNDVPILSQIVSDQTQALTQQIDELRKAVAEGKKVYVTVQDLEGLLKKSGIHLAAL